MNFSSQECGEIKGLGLKKLRPLLGQQHSSFLFGLTCRERESRQGVQVPQCPPPDLLPAPFLPLLNDAENAMAACRRPGGGGDQEVQFEPPKLEDSLIFYCSTLNCCGRVGVSSVSHHSLVVGRSM